MFKQYEQHENEKEKGIIQRIKEMDKDILIRIGAFVAVIILVTIFAFIKVHKKSNPELIRIVKDQNTAKKTIGKEKSDELILNETYRLNKDNFEIYISKKNESKGVIFLRPSDFIKNNNKLDLSDAVRSLTISGNPDILSHLSWSLYKKKYYINVSNNNINITLDDNSSKSELLLKINSDLISKDQIINDSPLLQIIYIESYAD